MRDIFKGLLIWYVKNTMPDISLNLKRAGMDDRPEEFIIKSAMASLYLGVLFSIMIYFFTAKQMGIWPSILTFPIAAAMCYFYLLKSPLATIAKREREINKEILFAGRFLIIELQSGIPLYNTLSNASKQYKALAPYIREVITKVDLGTTMEDALNESVETIPSDNFRKMLWQILNSLHTGADIASSLSSVLEQITREQMIEIRKYGRKLNPIAMFYMMVAVIIPTLGITMLVVLATMLGFNLKFFVLLLIAGGIGCVQLIFLLVIKNARPAVEL
jgi:pilus assembly protein TadC